ncbi:rhodanese-like domain-containing protein [Lichenihabitans sp. Uapishka_5]|uniref:rhodanese-like domain-containing protein n=1 Tax=Lichenihabitans sp. Uapishka_5 TaxID=3037302 RepID=UPI0029E8275D|nr:rhodanese-like domain-containing protein [Lichenihabitans sp. Uapishka_5]MDX7950666.1 rhodanese-like domain-containing protein [Lichenihabitans sp. Uapishka_5]
MTTNYAGDVSPEEAFKLLQSEPNAVLIDVRTQPEWQFVGIPDLSAFGRDPVLLEWQSYPTMQVNTGFVRMLEDALKQDNLPADAPLLFLCRSGARSQAAAATMAAAGHSRCYNVSGGFEGPPDSDHHRGSVAGWKALRLPWAQN